MTMTREEAIKILKAIRVYECYPKSASEETKEAIDMAIEALSERTGEWIYSTKQLEIVPMQAAIDALMNDSDWADAIPTIKSLPSADRPTGEWIEQESDTIEKIYLCSNCENYEAWGETEKTPYCPNCGAKMCKGGEEDD